MHSQHTKCTQTEHESILGHFFAGRGDLEVYLVYLLDRLLRATSKKIKKRSPTFLTRKVHPRQNPGYAYADWGSKAGSCDRTTPAG